MSFSRSGHQNNRFYNTF